ncbi:Tat pathway signal sequence domain protein [Enterovirga aerilata]|uniref:Tat pathway signal sequence domain protein n=1 Tax=Enterovirga aerilata TaxID=2730920 RepID=A0A849IEV2_9HYPH|nr:Tat pathway signal sequence domain protein [Enterovirga sp. DB1703]NNM74630.1 Tat pathway signal sequence domain protein [Enterovirga sp. DB1703]
MTARLIAVLALAAHSAGPALAQGAPDPKRAAPSITLELNKLEPGSGGCRAYFVVENRTQEGVKELRLDTFIFDGGGQITRRIGLTFPDIRPERTKVVPFDLNGAACPEIGRVLVNDVLACTGASGAPIGNCGDLLKVTARGGTRFDY